MTLRRTAMPPAIAALGLLVCLALAYVVGPVAFVLPKECRERLIGATLSSVREKSLQLCRMIVELPLGGESRQK